MFSALIRPTWPWCPPSSDWKTITATSRRASASWRRPTSTASSLFSMRRRVCTRKVRVCSLVKHLPLQTWWSYQVISWFKRITDLIIRASSQGLKPAHWLQDTNLFTWTVFPSSSDLDQALYSAFYFSCQQFKIMLFFNLMICLLQKEKYIYFNFSSFDFSPISVSENCDWFQVLICGFVLNCASLQKNPKKRLNSVWLCAIWSSIIHLKWLGFIYLLELLMAPLEKLADISHCWDQVQISLFLKAIFICICI